MELEHELQAILTKIMLLVSESGYKHDIDRFKTASHSLNSLLITCRKRQLRKRAT